MFSAKIKYVFIGLCFIVFAKADGCKQKYPDAHYKEFGCTPVLDKDGCPERYDCEKPLKLSKDTKRCYFLGEDYFIGGKIDDKLTQPYCITSAVCMRYQWRRFIYAQIECHEFPSQLIEGCFRQYKLDVCCSTATVCPPFPEDLATCKVGDKTVREGERFYPAEEDCLTCICQKGYSGENVAPFCKPINCRLALVNAVDFSNEAIPIYLEKKLCCPIGWIDYKRDDFGSIGKKLEGKADPMSCVFGDRVFAKGDGFQVEKDEPNKPDIRCECQLPPRLTCYQKPIQ